MAVNINVLNQQVQELFKLVYQLQSLMDGAASLDQMSQLNALRQAEVQDLQQRVAALEAFVATHSAAP